MSKNAHNPFATIPISEQELSPPSRENQKEPVQNPSNGPTHRKKKKSRRVPLLVLCLIVVYLSSFYTFPLLLKTTARTVVARMLDRPVTIGRASFNPFTLKISTGNTIVGPRLTGDDDGIDPVFSATQIDLDFSWTSLPRFALILDSVTIDGMFIHGAVNEANQLNLNHLVPPPQKASFPIAQIRKAVSWLGWPSRCLLKNIRVDNSKLLFSNLRTGEITRLEEIHLNIPVLGSLAQADRHLGPPTFSALLNGKKVRLDTMSAEEATSETVFELTDIPFGALNGFLPSLPIHADRGFVDFSGQLLRQKGPQDAAPQFLFEGEITFKQLFDKPEGPNSHVSFIKSLRVSSQFSLAEGITDLSMVEIEGADLFLAQDADGRLHLPFYPHSPLPLSHLTNLLEKAASTPFTIKESAVQFSGESFNHALLRQKWDAVNISLAAPALDFSSNELRPALVAPLNASVRIGKKSKLQMRGKVIRQPLKISGSISYAGGDDDAPLITQTLPENLRLSAAISSFNGTCELAADKTLQPAIKLAEMILTEVSLTGKNGHILKSPIIHLKDADFFSPNQRAHLGEIAIIEPTLNINLEQTEFAPLIQSIWSDAAAEKAALSFTADALSIEQGTLSVTCGSETPQKTIDTARFDLHMKKVPGTGTVQIQSNGTLPKAGSITVQGQLGKERTLAETAFSVSMNDMDALTFAPFLTDYFQPEIKGRVHGSGQINVSAHEFLGLLEIQHLSLAQNDRVLLKAGRLRLENLRWADRRLLIEKAGLEKFWFQQEMPSSWFPSLPAIFKHSDDAGSVAIDRLTCEQGLAELFFNQSRPGSGDTLTLTNVSGIVEGLTTGSQAANIDLSGAIDNGTINLLQGPNQTGTHQQIIIDALPLSNMSNTTAALTGFTSESGRLTGSIDLQSHAAPPQSISMTADLTFSNLIPREKAPPGGLPVIGSSFKKLPLLVALYEDNNNKLRGKVDLPELSQPPDIPGALISLLRREILKAAVSPFETLGDSLDLAPLESDILFRAGQIKLDRKQEKNLTELAKALQQRPQLKLRLTAYADRDADTRALGLTAGQERTALQRLAKQRALVVKDVLISEGIAARRIEIDPKGNLVRTAHLGRSGSRVQMLLVIAPGHS